mmetsp:Transcript_17716/g.29137  ORF Transcript_17716/g.29137 Transcript_17716/m.29137 type:complete len:220 (-) Transcript_17716:505-1164(-)
MNSSLFFIIISTTIWRALSASFFSVSSSNRNPSATARAQITDRNIHRPSPAILITRYLLRGSEAPSGMIVLRFRRVCALILSSSTLDMRLSPALKIADCGLATEEPVARTWDCALRMDVSTSFNLTIWLACRPSPRKALYIFTSSSQCWSFAMASSCRAPPAGSFLDSSISFSASLPDDSRLLTTRSCRCGSSISEASCILDSSQASSYSLKTADIVGR